MSATVQRLSQLRALKKEIQLEKQRLEQLRQLAEYGYVGNSTARGRGEHSDRTGKYAAEIVYLQQLISKNMQRAICELLAAQQFIDSIEDSNLRLIFKLRYIKCMSWQKIASYLEVYDEQLPRKQHNRYIAALEQRQTDAKSKQPPRPELYEAAMTKPLHRGARA